MTESRSWKPFSVRHEKWPALAVPITMDVPSGSSTENSARSESLSIMLRRNLLYTAVTRAKAKVILIGQKQAVFVAIHKCDVGQRNTVLADRIVAYYNRELSAR